LELLPDLQQRLGTAYLFIAHDLRVVVRLARRVAVMDAGRIAAVVDLDRAPQSPLDPALRCLMEAVPAPLDFSGGVAANGVPVGAPTHNH
jgi:ABC-type glutathione transport system ATPase component